MQQAAITQIQWWKTRLDEYPERRAEALTPLEDLYSNVNQGWEGLDLGAAVLTDGVCALKADALSAAHRRNLQTRISDEGISDGASPKIEALFSKHTAELVPASLLGYVAQEEPGARLDIAYIRD